MFIAWTAEEELIVILEKRNSQAAWKSPINLLEEWWMEVHIHF